MSRRRGLQLWSNNVSPCSWVLRFTARAALRRPRRLYAEGKQWRFKVNNWFLYFGVCNSKIRLAKFISRWYGVQIGSRLSCGAGILYLYSVYTFISVILFYIYSYGNFCHLRIFIMSQLLLKNLSTILFYIIYFQCLDTCNHIKEILLILLLLYSHSSVYKSDRPSLLQSPFGCSSFADLLSAPYTDPADAGSLPEELDPFPELQLGNPQGVPSVDESAQPQQSVHHQQPPQPPPPPPPLPEDVQADSLRYMHIYNQPQTPCFSIPTLASEFVIYRLLKWYIGAFSNRNIGCYSGTFSFGYSPTPLPSFQETYTVQRYTRQELQGLGIKMDEECYDNPVYSCASSHYQTEFPATVSYHEQQQPQQQHPLHHQQQQAPHHSYFSTESAPTSATAVVPPANNRQVDDANHRIMDSSYGVAVTVPMVYGAPPAIASVATPVSPSDLCPNVDTNVVVGTTRSRRASLPTQRSESTR